MAGGNALQWSVPGTAASLGTTSPQNISEYLGLGLTCPGLQKVVWFEEFRGYDEPSFVYGWLCERQGHSYAAVSFAALLIAASVLLKRRIVSPGFIREWNRADDWAARRIRDRRRKLRDMVNDPVLARDIERRNGDLTSLRALVREWERSGFFDVTKKELADEQVVMVGVSIHAFNRLLLIVFFMTMYHSYSSVAAFVVAFCAVHILDNLALHRAAAKRRASSSSRRGQQSQGQGNDRAEERAMDLIGQEVAVGVPVNDAEVAVPLMTV